MPDITRKQVIVVDTVESNDYGDMLFTDKEGNNYKISSKRVQYFEGVVVEGTGVELSYSTAYNKEYIYSAVQVKDGLPPPVKAETQRVGDAPSTSSDRDRNIYKQTTFKGAIELVTHGIITLDDIDLWWDKFTAKMNK